MIPSSSMTQLTDSQQALLAYFYKIATHPKVAAAGRSLNLRVFKDVVLERIAEDLPVVLAHVLGKAMTKAEVPARMAARTVAGATLGASLPPKVAEHAAGVMEEMIGEGFKWLGTQIGNLEKKGKRRA